MNNNYPQIEFMQKAERSLNGYNMILNHLGNKYTESQLIDARIALMDAYISLAYRDCTTWYFQQEINEKMDYLIYIITNKTQYYDITNNAQNYAIGFLNSNNQDKSFQYIRDYNGEIKITAKKNPPHTHGGIKRDKKTFKSYDRKLFNSISRSRQAIYELALCNDWEYFVTFTINKRNHDRFNLNVVACRAG